MLPPDAVRVEFSPAQMLVFPEITGVKEEFTFTITESVAGPQEVVTVTTYVVVEIGVATGFEILGLFNPVAGDQEYAVPPDASKVVLAPLQIVEFGETDTEGVFAVTSTGW